MATEKIVFETEVKTGNSGTSLKSVKRELAELKGLMASLDMESEEFTKAALKAAKLKDQINDANDALRNFDPGARFAAVTTVLGGVANGFSAAQGAMAIFGSESEDLEKVMVKTQGAIALATGLNGLQGMWGQLTIVANVIKTQVVAAFATMRAAIISTGIGALVVAIGVAINEIIKYNEAIDEEANAQERLNEELEKSKDLMEGVATASEKKRNAQKGGLDDLKRELQLLEAQGASEKTLFEKRQEIANAELRNLKVRKYSGLDVTKEIADKEQEIIANQYEYEKSIADKREEDAEKRREKEKERQEKNRKSNDEYAKLADEKFTKDMYAQIETQKTMNELTSQLERKEFEDSMKRYDAIQAANKAAMELDKAKKDAQLNNLMEVSDALSGFAALAGEQTAAGKAIAVAQTTIDTYVAAQKAYTSQLVPGDPTGPVRGIFFAAAAVASGIANVRRILSVQVPGGGGGGSVPSAGGQSVPQFNPAVAQQVQGGGDITLGQKPQRVYVVESDIRGTMNKVDVIEANATIG